VLANILLGPLKRLARPVRRLLAPRATVVLSGLMPEQANAARAVWCVEGLVLRRRQTIDSWVTLTLQRPARPMRSHERQRPGGIARPERKFVGSSRRSLT
jgi:ribosomal protein L11 methyltransferase